MASDAPAEGGLIPKDRPIMVIIGLTGAGKTTFINHIARTNFPVGTDMVACTTTTGGAVAVVEGVEVCIVDTPGFDDPDKTDGGVLVDLTEWIRVNLGGKRKVTAALYLHSIATEKMYGSSMKNFVLFQKLVGSTCMKNVGLVTTRWDTVPTDVAERREAQLSEKAWDIMLDNGARKFRTRNDYESCYAVMRELLQAQPSFTQIQTEMSKQNKPLSRTDAGMHVCKQIEGRIEDQKANIEAMRALLNNTDFCRNPANKASTEKSIVAAQIVLEAYMADLKKVEKVPTWSETAWNMAKIQGPAIAITLATTAFRSRGNSAALAYTKSQLESMVAKNAVLTTQNAALKSANGGHFGSGFAMGGMVYWAVSLLKKAFF